MGWAVCILLFLHPKTCHGTLLIRKPRHADECRYTALSRHPVEHEHQWFALAQMLAILELFCTKIPHVDFLKMEVDPENDGSGLSPTAAGNWEGGGYGAGRIYGLATFGGWDGASLWGIPLSQMFAVKDLSCTKHPHVNIPELTVEGIGEGWL